MDLVQETLEKLRVLVGELFPEYTQASFIVYQDGYLSISVVEWDKDFEKETEERKRRELFDQCRCSGSEVWDDYKEQQNAYYKRIGCLLEEEK